MLCLWPRIAVADHRSVRRHNNCSPLPGSMTAGHWVETDLVDRVAAWPVLAGKKLKILDRVGNVAGVRAFRDAVDVMVLSEAFDQR
jgi:hypothetical protein